MTDAKSVTPGADPAVLTRWMDAELPGLRQGDLSLTVIAGGRSNLTYLVTDGVQKWALRRPPLGHVLPTAHDMVREFTALTALAPTTVPVPTPVRLCADPDVLGAPFYLMDFVDGIVVDSPELVPDSAAAGRSGQLLVDTLVTLHEIDPASVGLAEFGRPDGFMRRQVARWYRQFEASVDAPDPVATWVVQQLAETVPEPVSVGIVHGDYRLTNVLFDRGLHRIEAVVDWEMATLGDCLADVGLLYVYHQLSEDEDVIMPRFPVASGFADAETLVQRYCDRRGIDRSRLDYYIAFGYFKLGVIAAGIDARFRQGLTVGAGFDRYGPVVTATLEAARQRLA